MKGPTVLNESMLKDSNYCTIEVAYISYVLVLAHGFATKVNLNIGNLILLLSD